MVGVVSRRRLSNFLFCDKEFEKLPVMSELLNSASVVPYSLCTIQMF